MQLSFSGVFAVSAFRRLLLVWPNGAAFDLPASPSRKHLALVGHFIMMAAVGRPLMAKVKCILCGHEWSGMHTYCPNCGSPTLPQRDFHFWKIVLVIIIVAMIIWLLIMSVVVELK